MEIKGFGVTQAEKAIKSKVHTKPKLQGFFGKEYAPPVKEKTQQELILDKLKSYDPEEIPDSKILFKYLPFDIWG